MPMTRPSASATSDIESAFAARSATTINCSVWWLISRYAKAAMVTSPTALTSASVSLLMPIFEFMGFCAGARRRAGVNG